ncbi:MAG: M48 family metallopeptidase [Candidatus Coproplasma sp.]
MIDIKYELVRSSRKTICISIHNNRIIVRAPMRTSVKTIEDYILRKRDWIAKHLSTDNCYNDLSSYEKVLVKGERLPLVFGDENKIEKDHVMVRSLSSLNKLYTQTFKEEFIKLFGEVSQLSGLKAKSVCFKSYKARWGCCDTQKRIVFNYKLLMLPTVLWRCVIVHELCHTVFMDHSKNFKMLVQSIMPNYNTVHKELKKYSSIIRLY